MDKLHVATEMAKSFQFKEIRMPNLGNKAEQHRALMLSQLKVSETSILQTAMRSEGNGQVACCNGNDEEPQ